MYIVGGKVRRKETIRKAETGVGVILRSILSRYDGVVWTVFIWARIGTREGSCERGNEPLGLIKCF
jgi:hypothetical protein